MRTIHHFTLIFTFVIFAFSLKAQTPQAFSYQAVARNASGSSIISTQIGIRISILDQSATGTVLYTESHTPTTNNVGLFALEIGKGTPTTGTFNTLDWGTNKKFLKIEMDAAGGTSYTEVGTTELLSVPYALYAEKVNPANLPTDKDEQTLSFSDDSLRISGGNAIKLPFQEDKFDFGFQIYNQENLRITRGFDSTLFSPAIAIYLLSYWFSGEEENIEYSWNLPTGVSYFFPYEDDSPLVQVGSGVDVAFRTDCNVASGVYPITITATSSVTNKVKTKTVNLEVIDAPNYTIPIGNAYFTDFTPCGDYFNPNGVPSINVSTTNPNAFAVFDMPYGNNGTGDVIISLLSFTYIPGCSLLTIPTQTRNLRYNNIGGNIGTVTISGTGTISGDDPTKPILTFNLTINGGTCTTHEVTMYKQ